MFPWVQTLYGIKIFSDFAVTEGIIVSLADKSLSLHTDVSALPFDEYLKKIAG
jgi:hypothetical protein